MKQESYKNLTFGVRSLLFVVGPGEADNRYLLPHGFCNSWKGKGEKCSILKSHEDADSSGALSKQGHDVLPGLKFGEPHVTERLEHATGGSI